MDWSAFGATVAMFTATLAICVVLAKAIQLWGPYWLLALCAIAVFYVVYDGIK